VPRKMRFGGRLLLAALLAVVATTGSACGVGRQPDIRRVDLEMRYSRFLPGHLEFEKGETVEFVITNTDPIDHEFILGDEVVQLRHETGTEGHHGAIPTELSVPAGSTVRTRVTLAEAGEFIIGCHLPRHYGYGMKASVLVTA
jgi:uncharacterized cupredoxin-like copper-binding protein